ncbi:hypothetical protein RZ766_020430, partial [Providencia rettgeri]|nr:hypothetical protein [Providencia rettgeri]
VLCKNIDIHKLAPRKSQYLITTEDRGQSVMLKCALNVRDLALCHLYRKGQRFADLFPLSSAAPKRIYLSQTAAMNPAKRRGQYQQ